MEPQSNSKKLIERVVCFFLRGFYFLSEPILKCYNNINPWIKATVDWLAIGVGILSFFLVFIDPDNYEGLTSCVATLAGVLGLLYLLYSIFSILHSVDLDWNLLYGNYMRKVICLVLLMPMTLALGVSCIISSPKELAYEDVIYACNDRFVECDIKKEQKSPSKFWGVYYHFIDPGNQHMATSKSGRAIAGIMAILGIFMLNGLLVSTMIGWIDRRRERWIKGEIKYRGFLKITPHYIIVGGNDMVSGIVKGIFEKRKREGANPPYILILTSRDIESFRRELYSELEESQQQKLILRYGSRNSPKDIAELQLCSAEEIFILGEEARTDDIESYHDTMNMRCLQLIHERFETCEKAKRIDSLNVERERLANKQGKSQNEIIELRAKIDIARENNQSTEDLEKEIAAKQNLLAITNREIEQKNKELDSNKLCCRVMFEYQTIFSVFQFTEISDNITGYIDFKPFNYYELWAQKVMVRRDLKPDENSGYLPLEGNIGIKQDDEKRVHLIIVGMSRMGVAMAIEAAHISHYPNFSTKRKRTKITFIDINANNEKDFFMGRFRALFQLSHWRSGSVVTKDGDVDALEWNSWNIPNIGEHLGDDFIDVEWEFINGSIEKLPIQEYIMKAVENKQRSTSIAICLPESNKALASAIYLLREIYEQVLQILVYNRYGDSLTEILRHENSSCSNDKPCISNPYNNKIKMFGMANCCYDRDYIATVEMIARRLNETYDREYEQQSQTAKLEKMKTKLRQSDKGEEPKPKVSEQPSEKEEKTGTDKPTKRKRYPGKSKAAKYWSNVYNANTMWTKLRSIGNSGQAMSPEETNILAIVEHDRWNMEQLLMNFRPLKKHEQSEILSLTKDEKESKKNEYKGKMAHPDICSYERLKEIDEEIMYNDVILTKVLPEIYQELNERCQTEKS